MYEYVITFDQEVTHVWTRKPTITSFLLLSIRWVMVFAQVSNKSPIETSTGCKSFSWRCVQNSESQSTGVLPLRSSQTSSVDVSHQLHGGPFDVLYLVPHFLCSECT